MDEPQKLVKKERRELKRQQKRQAWKKKERQKLFKRIALWVIVLVGIATIGFAIFKSNSGPSSNQAVLSVDAVADSDQTKGNSEARVILIEYSDFQCPACARYYLFLKQLSQEFGNQIQFVYRHFPLSQAHRNAEPAAFAAEAAGKQGKFWEMHDLIFEGQKDWSEKRNAKETFIGYAESLNLDMERFKIDVGSKEIKNKVRNDYSSGIKAGVNSTPTLFLNGKKLQNPRGYERLKNIIEQAVFDK
ncbi:MAG: thioredoxin domain-containing protein [Patescibacteria group bacterium]